MTPDQARADYRSAFQRVGEPLTLRRDQLDPVPEAVGLLARVVGFTPEELAAGMDQGRRKILLLAEDVERAIAAGRWPSPVAGVAAVLKNDTLALRGAPLNVESVDDSTRRMGGVLMAFEIVAAG